MRYFFSRSLFVGMACLCVASACARSKPAPVYYPPPPPPPPPAPVMPAPVPVPAPAPVPVVPPGPKRVIRQADIEQVVNSHFPTLAECYQEGVHRDPSMGGTLPVMLAIAGDGSVAGAHLSTSGAAGSGQDRLLKDPIVVACVLGKFRQMQFPPTNKGIVNLIYPVTFYLE